MMAYAIRTGMIALFMALFLSATATPGESGGVVSSEILKRFEEMGKKMEQMGQEIQKMGAEIKTLKKENKDLKAKLKKVDKEQAETKKAVTAKGVKRSPKKLETAIPKKPFKGGVQVDAKYLHLTTNRDAAPYAGKISNRNNNSVSIDAHEETEFDRNGAWRFGLSYVAPSGSDVGVKYMHFKTQGESSLGQREVDKDGVWANRLERSLADDVLNRDFDDGVVDYAEEELKLTFNIWDVELGHTFRTSDYTALRFFGGFRYIDMDNNSMITYENWEDGGIDHDVAIIENRLAVKGYGGRIGGGFMWDIWETGLSINIGAALSLIYANFETTRLDSYFDDNNRRAVRKVATDFDSFLPIIDVDLSLQYMYKWFFIRGGYTFSYWLNGDLKQEIGGWDDVDGETTPHHYEKADLSFHGWTIEAGVVF